MDWPILVLAALPGLVVWGAGFVTMIIRAPRLDPAGRLRWARMAALGFALIVLGPTVVFVSEGVSRGDLLRTVGPIVAFGPAILLMLWVRRNMRAAG